MPISVTCTIILFFKAILKKLLNLVGTEFAKPGWQRIDTLLAMAIAFTETWMTFKHNTI